MPTPNPRPARLAFEATTLDRFQRLTEDAAVTFTDTVKGSTTEGRALRHFTPAETYARQGVTA